MVGMAGMAGRRRKVFSDPRLELQPLRTGQTNNPTNNNGNNNGNNNNSIISPNSAVNNNNSKSISPLSSPNNPVTTTKTTTANHGNNKFNPRLIFSQIAAIQSIHYLVLSFFFQFNYLFFGTTITIDRIFTGNYLNVWTKEGWIDNGAVLASSVFGAFLLAFIVEKSKKCLDFSVTLFSIHLLICSIYDGRIPRSWDWWIIHVLGMIVMIVTGEYLCSRLELREIPLLL